MTSQRISLSAEDVAKLMADPSANNRAETARKIAGSLEIDGLSSAERSLASEILGAFARDAGVMVRQAVAESLSSSAAAPAEVISALAKDSEDTVALPVLQHSPLLDDALLMQVIRAGAENRQNAIAARKQVSEAVADVLIDVGAESAVATLMGNEGAAIAENSFGRAIDRFPASQLIYAPMVRRGTLPASVAERLVALVSDELQQHLVTHHALSPKAAADAVLQARERMLLRLVRDETDQDELETLTQQLQQGGRLTPSLVMRSVCMGDVFFFEAALARLAGIPLSNARILVHDGGALGLKALFERGGLPAEYLAAARVALDVARETRFDGGEDDIARRRRLMIERILTQFEGMDQKDIDYLLAKLEDFSEIRLAG